MSLQDVFLAPLGLLALLSVVPLVVLYFLRPQPRRLRIPTVEFLSDSSENARARPVFRRFQRELLFVLQLLALVLLAVSLASPYVAVSVPQTAGEAVLVVDASASMATRDGGTTRFARAVDAARADAVATTSVVASGAATAVVADHVDRETARGALGSLRASDAAGDLATAIRQASSLAGPDARLVVYSDFADDSDWRAALDGARATGLRVRLRQFAAGGSGNVGVVGVSFGSTDLTARVKNYGATTVTRTLALGEETRTLTLEPGDVTTATFPTPTGRSRLVLAPGDAFPTDDVVYVVGPERRTVRVLLLSNHDNRYLRTALAVNPAVDLTVASPPYAGTADVDVVIFGNVTPERVLASTVERARQTARDGGGVAVQAIPGVDRAPYGDLLLLEPTGTGRSPSVGRVADDPLTRDVTFPPPDRYLTGTLRRGRALVSTTDGTPLLATDAYGAGRLVYYGYEDNRSSFPYTYRYPVFWKRAVDSLAGRESLAETTRPTGSRLVFDAPTTVQTPTGTRTTETLLLDRAGFYETGGRTVAASLLSEPESNVSAPPVPEGEVGGTRTQSAGTETVPRDLSGAFALGALLVALGELGYLRYRGDL